MALIKKYILYICIGVLVAAGAGFWIYENYFNKEDLGKLPAPQWNTESQEELIAKMFPDKIGDYSLDKNNLKPQYECQNVGEKSEKVCGYYAVGQYRSQKKAVFVQILKMTQGADAQKNLLSQYAQKDKIGNYNIMRVESYEIVWISNDNLILTQEISDSKYVEKATGDNPVTQYFLANYSPVN